VLERHLKSIIKLLSSLLIPHLINYIFLDRQHLYSKYACFFLIIDIIFWLQTLLTIVDFTISLISWNFESNVVFIIIWNELFFWFLRPLVFNLIVLRVRLVRKLYFFQGPVVVSINISRVLGLFFKGLPVVRIHRSSFPFLLVYLCHRILQLKSTNILVSHLEEVVVYLAAYQNSDVRFWNKVDVGAAGHNWRVN
jgi:hypothetical protein